VTELFQFTLFGLMLGCIYAIAAMGLVLTYTVTGVFNFAHGAVGMICAFLYFELRVRRGMPTLLALVLVILVFAPLMGVIAERLLRRFQHADTATTLVVTVALTVALLGIAQRGFDPRQARVVPFLFGNHHITVLSVPITYDRIAQVVIAVAVAFGLRELLFGTRFGSKMRAVVDDRELARLRGVRSVLVARCSWMIGFSLAALGGILFAGGQNLNAIVLTLLVLNAYGAAMVGRLTNLPMTFVGALLLGLCQELTNVSWLWPDSESFSRLKVAIPGVFLIVAILLVPSFRLSAGRIVGRDQPRVPTVTRASVASVVFVVLVALFVTVGPDSMQSHVIRALVIATICLSLVALTGLSGQLSLTQYLFVGVGALVAGSMFGGRSALGMVLGGVVAAVLGAIVALPAVRLRGLHLALTTFGIALVAQQMIFSDPRVLGGTGLGQAVGRPRVLGLSTLSDGAFAIWCAVVFCLLAVAVVAVRRSWFGRQLTAVRDSELASATLGMPVRRVKVVAFAFSGFIAGCAGALFGGLSGVVTGVHFDPVNGIVILLYAFVGGITTVTGAALAGVVYALLVYVQSTYDDLAGLVFAAIGAVAIALGRQPNGVAGLVFDAARRLGRPDAGAAAPTPHETSAIVADERDASPARGALAPSTAGGGT
jgi:branched-chain amino acid transport system permease protein